MDGCYLPCGCQELNQGPLQEQVFLIAAPSLQPLTLDTSNLITCCFPPLLVFFFFLVQVAVFAVDLLTLELKAKPVFGSH